MENSTSSFINLRDWTRTKEDFINIIKIIRKTCFESYFFIPKEDIITYLEYHYNEIKLKELFDCPNIKGILAETNNQEIVGWMKLYYNQDNGKFFVSSLYVLPKFQGNGIGKKLLIKAQEIASSFMYPKLWIGVMNENKQSKLWYEKMGFNFIEETPFQMGNTIVNHLIGYMNIT